MTTNQLLNALTSHTVAATRLRARSGSVADSLNSIPRAPVDGAAKLAALAVVVGQLAEGNAAFDAATQ